MVEDYPHANAGQGNKDAAVFYYQSTAALIDSALSSSGRQSGEIDQIKAKAAEYKKRANEQRQKHVAKGVDKAAAEIDKEFSSAPAPAPVPAPSIRHQVSGNAPTDGTPTAQMARLDRIRAAVAGNMPNSALSVYNNLKQDK